MQTETIRLKLAEAGVDGADPVIVHLLEQPMVQAQVAAKAVSTITTAAGVEASGVDLPEFEDVVDVVLTSTRPVSAFEAHLERQQLAGWLVEAKAASDEVEAAGLLLGYDPLNPERTFQPADVSVTDELVSLGGAPLFRWDEVARASACRGSHTASYVLVDGRSVFLHADIDWFNALS